MRQIPYANMREVGYELLTSWRRIHEGNEDILVCDSIKHTWRSIRVSTIAVAENQHIDERCFGENCEETIISAVITGNTCDLVREEAMRHILDRAAALANRESGTYWLDCPSVYITILDRNEARSWVTLNRFN